MTSPGDSQPPKDWWLENACRIAAFRSLSEANNIVLAGQIAQQPCGRLPLSNRRIQQHGFARHTI